MREGRTGACFGGRQGGARSWALFEVLREILAPGLPVEVIDAHRAHPLKDWARRVKKRTSHKKACVALARKMAVILHTGCR